MTPEQLKIAEIETKRIEMIQKTINELKEFHCICITDETKLSIENFIVRFLTAQYGVPPIN